MNLIFDRQGRTLQPYLRVILFLGAFYLTVQLLPSIDPELFSGLDLKLAYPLLILTNITLSASILSLVVILLIRFLDKSTLTRYGFKFSALWVRQGVMGFFTGFAAMLFIFVLELSLGFVSDVRIAAIDGTFIAGICLNFILFALVAFYEELMNRAYVIKNIARSFRIFRFSKFHSLLVGWILSSVIFAGFHVFNPDLSLLSLFNLVIAGLFLGLPYLLTGELGYSIGLHLAWNFFQGAIFGFNTSGLVIFPKLFSFNQSGPEWFVGGGFGPEGGLISLLAMIFGTSMMLLFLKKKRPRASILA